MDIVVVGGSLGGLTAGTALLHQNNHVRILERNPTPLMHDQGAGIVLGGDTQRFLNRFILERRRVSVKSLVRQYLDKAGNVIDRDARHQQMTSWDLLYHLFRANFDCRESDYGFQTLVHLGVADAAAAGAYECGCTVTGIEDLGPEAGVRVTYSTTDGQTKTATAPLVVAADGASSTVRRLLLPNVERTYAGYVAWRGTVPEAELSASAAEAFMEKFTFFHAKGLQILAYLIPGPRGATEKGKRLLNWVWYCNYAEDSAEHRELMMGKDGRRHAVTVPPGAVNPAVWEKQKKHAEVVLPPQFAEVVRRTETPFVQAITDVLSPRATFFDGRVLLIGDALAGFRPHTAASTSQAAFDAMEVADLVAGKIGLEEWEGRVLEYAREVQRRGVELGERSQFGRHPLADGG